MKRLKSANISSATSKELLKNNFAISPLPWCIGIYTTFLPSNWAACRGFSG